MIEVQNQSDGLMKYINKLFKELKLFLKKEINRLTKLKTTKT